MKKILLILIGVAIVTSANATRNPFERTNKKTEARNKTKSIMSNDYRAKVNAVVPTLTKQSYWESLSNDWQGSFALKSTYANDVIVSTLQMNYAQTDTIIKQTYTYNSNKQLIQTYTEQYIGGVFIPIFRNTYTYDNLKEFLLSESYEASSQTWLPTSRNTIEYNSRGEQIKNIYEQNSGGVWQVQSGYSTYINYLNNTNKIVELIDSSYNFNTMQMEADYREIKTYNANGEAVEILMYESDGMGSLVLTTKDSVFYTAGLPNKLLQYEYDSVSNSFQKTLKFDQLTWLNFDSNVDLFDNEPVAYWISSWQNNAWKPETRTSTTFPDANGSLVELTEAYNNLNVWVNQSRYSEFYNANKDVTENSNEIYNSFTRSWQTIYGERFIYQYDANNNITEEINEEFNIGVNAYEKTNKYEYSDFITIVLGVNTHTKTLETKLFPNPSSDGNVSIQVNLLAASALTVKVCDMKGSVVYTDERTLGKGLNTVELKNLEQGIYIVELNTEYGISIAKLVVQ